MPEIPENFDEAADGGLRLTPCSRSSSTPITDQRIELLKSGHSNCVPKWEDFAKELEREMNKWKSECKRQWMHLSQARHNARAIQNIRWGYEGDCGADRLANLIEEDCHRGMISSENKLLSEPCQGSRMNTPTKTK